MLETPHSLLGGAIGALTGDWRLAIPVATASHFAGDIMPHWNPKFPFTSKKLYAFVIADFVIAGAIVIWLWVAFPSRPEIATGALCGMIPDIILGIRFTFKLRWLRPYEWFHDAIHHEVRPLYGIPPQLVVSAASIAYLLSR